VEQVVERSPGEVVSREGDDLDPDIRRFVREMGAGWARHPEFSLASPLEARRIAEIVRAPWTEGGPAMAASIEYDIAGGAGAVRVRCYDPGPSGVKPALVYLHGGGWTIFSLDTHDRLMREYAARAGVVVVGVDYALSPEAKYPVALDQVEAVMRELLAHGARYGVDRSRVAVGGDSAGANLSVAACLRLRDRGIGGICGMLLNYGVFDRRSSREAQIRYGGFGYMLSVAEMDEFWANYLRDERDADDPCVCPVKGDLRGLPQARLVVPECDLLTEQSDAMADRLRAAGVPVSVDVYAGATHSFLEAVSVAPIADRAIDASSRWLRGVLGPGGSVTTQCV
jgi:acetyl esterase